MGLEADAGAYGLLQVKGYLTDAITDDLAFPAIGVVPPAGWLRPRRLQRPELWRPRRCRRPRPASFPAQRKFPVSGDLFYEQQEFSGVPSVITGVVPAKGTALNLYQRLDLAIPDIFPPSNAFGHITDTNNYYNNVGYKHTLTGTGDLTLDGG